MGLAPVQDLLREPSIVNISLKGVNVDVDKVTRSLPLAARAEQGKVAFIKGPWITACLDELMYFPAGRYDDQVDCLSGGLAMLAKPRRKILYA